MLADVVDLLACPVCGRPLTGTGPALRCSAGHAFDVARQGYVNLMRGSAPTPGDTVDMIASRDAFLSAGHFAPIAERIRTEAAGVLGDRRSAVAEMGAGTAYYLSNALDVAPHARGVALDVSKAAARHAARAHPRIGAVVCDSWVGLPLRDGSMALLLDVFAPRNVAEMRRVLEPTGMALMVTPSPDHLSELVGVLGLLSVDADKLGRTLDGMRPFLRLEGTERIEYEISLDAEAVRDLVMMGPSAHHVDPDVLERYLGDIEEMVSATVSVDVTRLRPE